LAKDDPWSGRIQAEYDKEFPGKFLFAAGSAATGTYRGLKLGRLPSRKTGKLDRESVAAALDHAKLPNPPADPRRWFPASATAR